MPAMILSEQMTHHPTVDISFRNKAPHFMDILLNHICVCLYDRSCHAANLSDIQDFFLLCFDS